MDGGRRAGEVVDLVDFDQDGLDHIVTDQLKVGVGEQMGDIFLGAREKIVDANHVVSALHQELA